MQRHGEFDQWELERVMGIEYIADATSVHAYQRVEIEDERCV